MVRMMNGLTDGLGHMGPVAPDGLGHMGPGAPDGLGHAGQVGFDHWNRTDRMARMDRTARAVVRIELSGRPVGPM